MIKQLSDNITFFLLRENIINKEEQEVYSYGFEYIMSIIIGFLGIALLAVYTKSILDSIGFIVGFIMIRSVAGGYHEKTHMKCYILSYLVYIVNIFILKVVYAYLNSLIVLSVLSIVIVLVFIFAPVDHPNRPFSDEEYLSFRNKSRRVVIIGSLFCFFGFKTLIVYQSFFIAMILGMLTAAFSLLVAVKIKEGESK